MWRRNPCCTYQSPTEIITGVHVFNRSIITNFLFPRRGKATGRNSSQLLGHRFLVLRKGPWAFDSLRNGLQKAQGLASAPGRNSLSKNLWFQCWLGSSAAEKNLRVVAGRELSHRSVRRHWWTMACSGLRRGGFGYLRVDILHFWEEIRREVHSRETMATNWNRDRRGKPPTGTVRQWLSCQEVVQSQPLGDFRTWLHKALSNLVWSRC